MSRSQTFMLDVTIKDDADLEGVADALHDFLALGLADIDAIESYDGVEAEL